MDKGQWWTHTWNPVTGCTPITEGCANCYAKRMSYRLAGRCGYPEDNPFRPTFHPDKLVEPFRWRKHRSVFAVSMGDLFHQDISFNTIAAVFGVMAFCQNHTFMVLTKRSKRMREFFALHNGDYQSNLNWWLNAAVIHLPDKVTFGIRKRLPDDQRLPLPNVIGMVTAENQECANLRIPDLLESPFAVRGVSVGPMIGPVNLRRVRPAPNGNAYDALSGYIVGGEDQPAGFIAVTQKLDWVVCEGESGPGARPMEHHWPIDLKDDCVWAGVPFLFKQHGEWVDELHPAASMVDPTDDRFVKIVRNEAGEAIDYYGLYMVRVGRKRAGRILEGSTWDQYPII